MNELDVINDALSTLGEAPLNDADENHPFVPTIKRIMAQENRRIQQLSWWFNLELITLTPDVISKFIYTPEDSIRCDPTNKNTHNLAVQRGRRLYNTDLNTYEFNGSVDCFLVREIPFEDLPPTAQDCISIATSRSFQKVYDADNQRVQQLDMQFRIAMTALKTEHIRNRKSNFIYKNSSLNELFKIGGGISPSRSFSR